LEPSKRGVSSAAEESHDIKIKASAAVPKIATFRDWLLAEAAADLRQLKRLAREPASKKATRAHRSDRPSRRKP